MLSDPILLRVDEQRFWFSTAESTLLPWALAAAHWSGLDVQVQEADVGPVQVQGTKALEVMVDLFGESVRDIRHYWSKRYELDGMDVVVSQTGFTNVGGYEIYLEDASKHADRLWDTVYEAGQPHGLQVTGPVHINRIEAGILSYDADMTLDTNPLEVAFHYPWLEREIDQETPYIGQPALQHIRDQGVDRKLVGVEIDGESVGSYTDGSMPEAFPVHHNEQEVGFVSSACYWHRLKKNIGFAMVPVGLAENGTTLQVETWHGTESATVVDKPFLKG